MLKIRSSYAINRKVKRPLYHKLKNKTTLHTLILGQQKYVHLVLVNLLGLGVPRNFVHPNNLENQDRVKLFLLLAVHALFANRKTSGGTVRMLRHA